MPTSAAAHFTIPRIPMFCAAMSTGIWFTILASRCWSASTNTFSCKPPLLQPRVLIWDCYEIGWNLVLRIATMTLSIEDLGTPSMMSMKNGRA
ncbi:hypothetical protein BDW69DRAFT_6964 [Aspergillus filifer]